MKEVKETKEGRKESEGRKMKERRKEGEGMKGGMKEGGGMAGWMEGRKEGTWRFGRGGLRALPPCRASSSIPVGIDMQPFFTALIFGVP